jgi:hypothetical protein
MLKAGAAAELDVLPASEGSRSANIMVAGSKRLHAYQPRYTSLEQGLQTVAWMGNVL